MSVIGIYPGSFDPLHKGHIAFAATCMEQCSLSEVALLPEPRPRGKQNIKPYAERFAALESAVMPLTDITVLETGCERFTVAHTLPEILKYADGRELSLLVGSDTVRHMKYWNDIATLFGTCRIAIGLRDDSTEKEMRTLCAELTDHTGIPFSYTIIRTSFPHLSSSMLRSAAI